MSPRHIYSEMKNHIQTFADFSEYTRYTFYETWFNKKNVIAVESKNGERRLEISDFSIVTETTSGNPKTESIGSKNFYHCWKRPSVNQQLFGSKNSYHSSKPPNVSQQLSSKNIGRSLGVTSAGQKVLFKCDSEEIPLS